MITATQAATTAARSHRGWQLGLAVCGIIAGAISVSIGMNRYGPHGSYSLSQANGLCSSAFGQFAQVMNNTAHANCASVTAAEQARGWLMIAAVAAVLAAAAWALYDLRARR